jgi:hypothetical protein
MTALSTPAVERALIDCADCGAPTFGMQGLKLCPNCLRRALAIGAAFKLVDEVRDLQFGRFPYDGLSVDERREQLATLGLEPSPSVREEIEAQCACMDADSAEREADRDWDGMS